MSYRAGILQHRPEPLGGLQQCYAEVDGGAGHAPQVVAATATLCGATPGMPVQVLDALAHVVRATVADAKGTAALALPAGL